MIKKEPFLTDFSSTALVYILCTALAVLTLSGCATRVSLQAKRAPNLDTSGIQRIAIMPFEPTTTGTITYQNAARHATTVAIGNIQATNHFTLVSSSTVNDARRRREGIENYVDATFSGQVTFISEKTTTHEGQRRDKEGNTITYTYYVREVSVEFNYSFTRARDGTLIGPILKKGSTSDNNEDISNLASVDSLVNSIINSQFRNLGRDVAPYTTTISRTLEKEPRKDLKPQMEEALSYVKGSNYMLARQAYLSIWEFHRSVAAAVNASILYEALGETKDAADFMQQVYSSTGSPLAGSVLARLNMELAEQAKMGQFDDTRSRTERVATLAFNEARKVLPANAKVWIHNNATVNQDLASGVVDNMISSFLANGIAVVERQMIDIVLREQNFQLSGNVSDNDFVSIGNLAGANTVIIVDTPGTGALRRLQIRVLDIRAGTVLMQSGTGSEWSL